MIFILLVLLYIACGVVGYGYTLGYWWAAYPQQVYNQWGGRADQGFAIFTAILGPLGCFVAVMSAGGAKPRWTYPTKAECLAARQKSGLFLGWKL